jgi:hypothetical protein
VKSLNCEECGEEFADVKNNRASRRFCSDRCRYRARDRRDYQADPERERARVKAYYAKNREQVLARAKARRKTNAA